MSGPDRVFVSGDVVRHFKRLELTNPDLQYLYEFLGVASHTETGEEFAIYRALYGERKICARPLDMFMSEVDRDKYPNAKQQYRFERVPYAGLVRLLSLMGKECVVSEGE